MERFPPPPYELRTERLSLRPFDPSQAERLQALTAVNVEHLRPWMPWAQDLPHTLERTIEVVRRMRADFERGRDFNYLLFERTAQKLLGGAGLHPRVGPGGLEIGYWIARERTGHGYGTEAAGALTRAGFEYLGAARVEIHVQPENRPSLAIPERLGFVCEGRRRAVVRFPDGSFRDQLIYTLLASELPSRSAGSVYYEAFDAIGRIMKRAGA